MNSFYKDLADAIWGVSPDSFEEVTLSEALTVNGNTFRPGTTLKIQRPIICQH